MGKFNFEDRSCVTCCHYYHPQFWIQIIFVSDSDLPQTEIRLGGSLNSSNIREFDDVYFECRLVNICQLFVPF